MERKSAVKPETEKGREGGGKDGGGGKEGEGEGKGGKRWVGKWGARGSKAVREVKLYTSLNLLPSSCCPMHIPHTIPHTHLLTYTSPNIHLALSPLTERFIHREVGLDNKHGCPNHLALLKHMPPAAVQHTIDPTDSHLWALS